MEVAAICMLAQDVRKPILGLWRNFTIPRLQRCQAARSVLATI
jgi:hypothetical protein